MAKHGNMGMPWCLWCGKEFTTADGLRQHQKATRHQQFVRKAGHERQRQAAALQHYHQDKVAARSDPAEPDGTR